MRNGLWCLSFQFRALQIIQWAPCPNSATCCVRYIDYGKAQWLIKPDVKPFNKSFTITAHMFHNLKSSSRKLHVTHSILSKNQHSIDSITGKWPNTVERTQCSAILFGKHLRRAVKRNFRIRLILLCSSCFLSFSTWGICIDVSLHTLLCSVLQPLCMHVRELFASYFGQVCCVFDIR